MELNSVKIHQNYEKILENVKKYSPYPEKVKILFVSKYLNVEEHKAVIDMGYDYFGENRAQLYRDKLNEFSDEKYKNILEIIVIFVTLSSFKGGFLLSWYQLALRIKKKQKDRIKHRAPSKMTKTYVFEIIFYFTITFAVFDSPFTVLQFTRYKPWERWKFSTHSGLDFWAMSCPFRS